MNPLDHLDNLLGDLEIELDNADDRKEVIGRRRKEILNSIVEHRKGHDHTGAMLRTHLLAWYDNLAKDYLP